MSVFRNPHDRFFKEVFSRPAVADDFLRQFLPEEVRAQLDLSTLDLRKESFIDPDLQQQFADLLYGVRLADERQAWVYILFEHKSYPQPLMAFQLLRYMVRIWEQGLRQTPNMPPAPIIPIVIYHGTEAWREPLNMGALFNGPTELRPFWPTFNYQLHDLAATDASLPEGKIYLQAALLLMQSIGQPNFVARLPAIMRLLGKLTRNDESIQYVTTVFYYVAAARPEVTVDQVRKAMKDAMAETMEEQMSNWVDDLIEQGIEQGMVRGKQEGMTAEAHRLVTRQLRHRFGNLPPTLSDAIDRLSLDELESLSTAILDAKSIADVENYLDRLERTHA